MKRLALILLVALLAIASGSALAHGRGRVTLGFHFGGPLGWYHPWYYAPPPVYYYPSAPVVVQPPAPTTYVERSDVVRA